MPIGFLSERGACSLYGTMCGADVISPEVVPSMRLYNIWSWSPLRRAKKDPGTGGARVFGSDDEGRGLGTPPGMSSIPRVRRCSARIQTFLAWGEAAAPFAPVADRVVGGQAFS
jgi:hypothetical protein